MREPSPLSHCSGRIIKLLCLHWSGRLIRTSTVIVKSTSFWPLSTIKYRNLQYVAGNLTSSSNVMLFCKLLIKGKAVTTEKSNGRREAYQHYSHSQCGLHLTAVHVVVTFCTCPLWSI